MKKTLPLLCVLLLLLAAVGCSSESSDASAPVIPMPSDHTAASTAATSATVATSATAATQPTDEPTSAPTAEPTSAATTEPTSAATTAPTTAPTVPASDAGGAIADLAYSLIGSPFRSGGSGPDSFDNTGFAYYCYRQNGLKLPRRVSGMLTFGSETTPDNLQRGDLLIYSNEIGGSAAFVGIYIGDGKFVATYNPEKGTKEQVITNSYFKARFIAARHWE